MGIVAWLSWLGTRFLELSWSWTQCRKRLAEDNTCLIVLGVMWLVARSGLRLKRNRGCLSRPRRETRSIFVIHVCNTTR